MINRGVVAEIPPQELDVWSGPVIGNTHHDDLKDSATTPVKLVSNSSFKKGTTSLNEFLVKGPNTSNYLYSKVINLGIM